MAIFCIINIDILSRFNELVLRMARRWRPSFFKKINGWRRDQEANAGPTCEPGGPGDTIPFSQPNAANTWKRPALVKWLEAVYGSRQMRAYFLDYCGYFTSKTRLATTKVPS